MHVRGLPHQWRTLAPVPDLVSLVRRELNDRLSHALDAGIARHSIVLDPGFGFGKNFDENYCLLARFAEFHLLGVPLLAAVSRKSFLARTVAARLSQLAELTGAPLPQSADVGSEANSNTSARNAATWNTGTLHTATLDTATLDTVTQAATVAAALAGAHIVRVHAVRPAVEALAIADAILHAQPNYAQPKNARP